MEPNITKLTQHEIEKALHELAGYEFVSDVPPNPFIEINGAPYRYLTYRYIFTPSQFEEVLRKIKEYLSSEMQPNNIILYRQWWEIEEYNQIRDVKVPDLYSIQARLAFVPKEEYEKN